MRGLPLTALGVCVMVGGGTRVSGGDRITGRQFATRSEVIARHGMAATSQPLATQVALDILKQGGSAVDAAIAANAALGLMEPTGSGIGGDLFAIVWDARNEELIGLNASGRAPALMTLDYFRENGIEMVPQFGALPVVVPGTVDGWFELHGRFGRLPMQEVLAPAIRYAREGFPVSEIIAEMFIANRDRIGHYPGFADTYMPDGDVPAKGEMFRNPRLAATLEAIAEKVSQWHCNRRLCLVVPVHLESDAPQVMRIVTRYRYPDSLNDTGAFRIQQHRALPCTNLQAIGVFHPFRLQVRALALTIGL